MYNVPSKDLRRYRIKNFKSFWMTTLWKVSMLWMHGKERKKRIERNKNLVLKSENKDNHLGSAIAGNVNDLTVVRNQNARRRNAKKIVVTHPKVRRILKEIKCERKETTRVNCWRKRKKL